MRKPLLITLFCGFIFFSCKPDTNPVQKEYDTAAEPIKAEEEIKEQDSLAVPTTDKFGVVVDSMQVEEHQVRRNESLYLILDKFGFNAQDIYSITQQANKLVDLKAFRPGQVYKTYTSDRNKEGISKLIWQPNLIEYVVFDWEQDSLEIYKASRPLTTKTAVTAGEISNSLYHTISDQGVSSVLGYKMSQIFAWQIDFFGLREGDTFKALYKNRYVDEEYLGVGEILAAEFVHRGETFRAYRFRHGEVDGYFTEEGESVQKALLKAPFEYSQRISSRFSYNRLHPITKKRRPHLGVDYAAPTGTPVLSVGDGVVTEAQYRGANGNIVKIKHNSTYRTAYLHLNGFARGIRKGVRVKQGQTIGYVGSTGRSTGPHLDYRIYKNNKAVNPLNVELPSSDSVPDTLIAEFQKVKKSLDLQWEGQGKQEKDRGVITQQSDEDSEEDMISQAE